MPQLIASVEGVEIHHVYLTLDRTTLGRKPHNHIVLADLAVSGEHCAFEIKGLSDVYVQDMGSTNGTYINGAMVKRQLLQNDDVITIGKFKVLYRSANELTDNSTAAMPLELPPTGSLNASLKVLVGSSAGLEVPVVKAVSTFGKPGVAMLAIAHRRQGYYVSCMDATAATPKLNGQTITDEPRLLADHDVLDLAGTSLQFLLR
jgi:pSer/pThr/pTyr-binding forkhead associated (FHA) protein